MRCFIAETQVSEFTRSMTYRTQAKENVLVFVLLQLPLRIHPIREKLRNPDSRRLSLLKTSLLLLGFFLLFLLLRFIRREPSLFRNLTHQTQG